MPGIKIGEDESMDNAIRRFRKQVEKAGIMQELRKREHYEKPSVKRARRRAAGRKRAARPNDSDS